MSASRTSARRLQALARGDRGGARRGHGGDARGRLDQRARTSCARCARRARSASTGCSAARTPRDGVAILDGAVKYCPFPGTIDGHPSVLEGSIDAIADDAARLTALDGVHGVDLLAYRHATEDPIALTRAVAEAADGPVIAAGLGHVLRADRGARARGRVGLHDRHGDLRRPAPGRAERRRPGRRRARGDRVTTARRPSLVDQVRQGLLDDLVAGKLDDRRQAAQRGPTSPSASAVSRATVREAVLGLLEAGYLTPPPRLGHLRDQGAAQPPRAGHAPSPTRR